VHGVCVDHAKDITKSPAKGGDCVGDIDTTTIAVTNEDINFSLPIVNRWFTLCEFTGKVEVKEA